MTGKTHTTIGVASLLTLAYLYEPQNLGGLSIGLALMANTIGSLLPDIDQASNRLWGLLPGGNFMARYLRRIFLGHRTITHSVLGIYIVYRLISWLGPLTLNVNYLNLGIIEISLMTGYLAHLLADSLTEEGLPLFFPLAMRVGIPPIRSWRIKTGRWFENLVIFPLLIVYIVFLIWKNWQVYRLIF